MQRHILHVDMDAFYASVEQRDRPELAGKPLAVGGGKRGVVAAASYEARRYGIHSAMPMSEALRRCPGLLRVKPRMAVYRDVSRQVFEVFRETTPLVEGLSLDEAFLDVTASIALLGSAEAIAERIKAQIRERMQLTASVGVAPNKLVAKIASDLDKPDGLVAIGAGEVVARLDPLPVRVLPGIGRETGARLREAGIGTVGELRTAPDSVLCAIFHRYAARMRERASGIDERPVVADRAEKSVSAEETFADDMAAPREMERELLRLADRVAERLRRKRLIAGTVQVKIRRADFTTYTRQRRLAPAANDTRTLHRAAVALLRAWLAGEPGAKLRLLGVGASDLAGADQLDLFEVRRDAAGGPLDKTVDAVRERFGSAALGPASTIAERETAGTPPRK